MKTDITLNGVHDDTPDATDPSTVLQSPNLPTVAPTSVARAPHNTGLNHALTFDRFVVGESNQKAYDAGTIFDQSNYPCR